MTINELRAENECLKLENQQLREQLNALIDNQEIQDERNLELSNAHHVTESRTWQEHYRSEQNELS